MADVSDSTIVDVPGVNVRLVDVAQFHTVPVPDNVQVLEPIISVRVLVLLDENVVAFNELLVKSNVPDVSVQDPFKVTVPAVN